MAELIITRGLPGSGKTTYARARLEHRLLEATSGYPVACMVRVNRDDLRAMLHVGEWSADQEDATKAARDALIDNALFCGLDVICDDTHLLESEVEWMANLALERGATFTVVDLRHVPIEECIRRDAARDQPVGQAVIDKLAVAGGLV